MIRPPWELVSKAVGVPPIASIDTNGRPALRVERYFFQIKRQQLPEFPIFVLIVHLGGARASGKADREQAANYIPGVAVLIPPGCASEWIFDGAVDAAFFYFTDESSAAVKQLNKALNGETSIHPFIDNLVSAATLQLVYEIGRGSGFDEVFVRKIASVVVDQLVRVLAGVSGQRISPDRFQLGRLNVVIDWLAKNLDREITNAMLAEQAGISESHFRHMFMAAMGISPMRYVQQRRIERARELLANTNIPITHITATCGFVSQSYLTTCFKATYGITPAQFRRSAN